MSKVCKKYDEYVNILITKNINDVIENPSHYMEKIKKQATVVVIRIEQATYWAALGVWVVRETVKKSLEKDGMKFDSKEEMLSSCKKIGKIKYDYDCSQILNKSKLLTQINTQKNLGEWF